MKNYHPHLHPLHQGRGLCRLPSILRYTLRALRMLDYASSMLLSSRPQHSILSRAVSLPKGSGQPERGRVSKPVLSTVEGGETHATTRSTRTREPPLP